MEADTGIDWSRIFSALRLRLWLVLLVTAIGTTLGVLYAGTLRPTYTAEARIWFEESGRGGGGSAVGPIQSGQLLGMNSWEELFRSYRVLDPVVRELDLYLRAPRAAAPLFEEFDVDSLHEAGDYRLRVAEGGRDWTLSRTRESEEAVEDRGTVGDSIGTELGLYWSPDTSLLEPGLDIQFTVLTIRDASRELREDLNTIVDLEGSFMLITLSGTSATQAARAINLAMERFEDVAAVMKSGRLTQSSDVLEEQLALAEASLDSADAALEAFRIRTSSLAGGSDAGALSESNPLRSGYFALLGQRDEIEADRARLEGALEEVRSTGEFPMQELIGVDPVQQSPEIQNLLAELSTKRTQFRDLLRVRTETSDTVQNLNAEIRNLETALLPERIQDLIGILDIRILALEADIETREANLEAIPARIQDEQQLIRDVASAEARFRQIQQGFEDTRFAELSSIPDFEILDPADASMIPENQPGVFVMLFAFFGSLGLAVAGVVLLDRTDRRLRYPSQITQGMGLNILGGIPRLKSGRGKAGKRSESEVMEAFRSLCLNLDHAYGTAGPTLVTITSPDMGDGKSFITSNLANSFARQRRRTVVIDGDTRRGVQHQVFNGERIPGLTDYLEGDATMDEIVRRVDGHHLAYIPSGRRSDHSPEQLNSRRMRELLSDLKSEFDVILVDTPPIRAGVDPLALATITGNLLLVMRTGATDVVLTESNLEVLDQLPVRVLGAVLNDISPRETSYQRYSFRSDYAIEATADEKGIGAGGRPLLGTGGR